MRRRRTRFGHPVSWNPAARPWSQLIAVDFTAKRSGCGVYIEPLKTYRPRFVFLPDEGMYWFLRLIQGRKPSDLVFIRDNVKPLFGNQKHLFKAAVREVGLPGEFSFHGLRHT